jgi:hypothetical protein
MLKSTIRTLTYLTIFSIAMGYLECAVVVYLRRIFYPEGFEFPLKMIDPGIGITEIIREAATLVMLAGAGVLAGRTRTEKFGFFLYCFAIWDIFYYVFLKMLLDWPQSFLTWDILFLIPITWEGPVIGPVINSLTMIIFAWMISYFSDKNPRTKIILQEWTLLILGSLVMILAYTWDYIKFINVRFEMADFFVPSKQSAMIERATGYIPQSFPWWLFILGELFLISALLLFSVRNAKILKGNIF